ncbi:hypothetical protein E2R51_08010 [Jeotgalibacillus sp. S-D1]|uniref:CDP-glycerol glycerophosphotransferase family protein n=1 Tax=Jeotgalibacillus sp. S-D1 TaxID=2552189 RepID=UPI00105A9668|nr:CDP-glycerol glycerophosphotransferase family protein [Jeotgalibacillus sp. S-D1]TDL32620.1 hypothetical protein E2R51_08010 [Jeotgalibacillus sp. S-D1]
MRSTSRKVARVSKRILINKIKSTRSSLVKLIKSEVSASEIKIENSILTISGVAKFLHLADLSVKPLTMSLVNPKTKEALLTEEVTIDTLFNKILPGSRSAFTVAFDLSRLSDLQDHDVKFNVILNFNGTVQRSHRLYVPVKAVEDDFINSYICIGDTLFAPYRTSFGNLSINALSRENIEIAKNLPNKVEQYDLTNGRLHLKGWVDTKFLAFFNQQFDLSVGIKRRGSHNIFFLPMDIVGEKWSVEADLTELDLTKGIWDYYICLKDQETIYQYRMKIFEKTIFNEKREFFYPTDKESLKGVHYRTKQKGLSINIKPILITSDALDIHLDDDTIHFHAKFKEKRMRLAEDDVLTSMSLFLRQRDSDEGMSIPLMYEQSEKQFTAVCSFKYADLLHEPTPVKKIWDAYIEVTMNNESRRFRLKTNQSDFTKTSRKTYPVDDSLYAMYFYLTIYKRLSITYSLVPLKRNVTSFRFDNLDLILKGSAYIEGLHQAAENETRIAVRNRVTEEEIIFPVSRVISKLQSIRNFQRKEDHANSMFEARISLIELQQLIVSSKDILDFYVEIKNEKIIRREKIGLKEYNYFKDDVLASTDLQSKYEQINISYCLTITPRGNLKVETFKMDKSYSQYLKQSVDQEEIWLIGERPDTAQDTGYHFFKYCRLTYPDQKVYYAIEEGSHDLKNIEYLGNVLISGSPEHFDIASKATVLIGSHDFDYFLPFKGIQSANYKDTVKVFLQHGVLGRKMVEYNKKYYKQPFDIFCVSSTDEKTMVMEQLGYDAKDLRVTGLSRFDELLKDHNPKREILLIPTWREWLNTTDALLQSEYLSRYTSFLKNPELIRILKENNLVLNFYPHYRMQQFFDEFGTTFDETIRFIRLGEKNVQDLLKENKLMITDYSSVSFDFTYLSKPVIYYHFDRDSFFKGGIMRPFEETFLGDIANSEDELIHFIRESIEANFKENEEVKSKKDLIFDRVDQLNCQRIYQEITKERNAKRSE